MTDPDRIIAFGLLTRHDLDLLGSQFERAWPVDQTPCFGDLLHAIDMADQKLRRARAAEEAHQPIMKQP